MKLGWKGIIDVKDKSIVRLVLTARGTEKLTWGDAAFAAQATNPVSHLPAGRPIDQECEVRYGMVGEPVSEDQIGRSPAGPRGPAPPPALQVKMRRLQKIVKEWRAEGRDLQPIGRIMEKFGLLLQDGKMEKAEAILDKALKKLGKKRKP